MDSVLNSSNSVEHYTPAAVLDLVIEVMGGIDLDPCADPGRKVPATIHYTAAEDGLSKPWAGRVYMNPPYGRTIGKWVNRLKDFYEAGHVEEAIALVPGRIDPIWWRRLTSHGGPVLFYSRRLKFVGNKDSAPFPSALVYMGPGRLRFCRAASRYGDIWGVVMPEGENGRKFQGGGR